VAETFNVHQWEVRTIMEVRSSKQLRGLIAIEVTASPGEEPMRSLILGHDESDEERPRSLAEVLVVHPRFRRFETPFDAATEYLSAAGDLPPSLTVLFWREARIPVFGSPPEGWTRLAEMLGTGSAGALAAIMTLRGDPVQLVLVFLGVTVAVRIIDPVAKALGSGLASRVEQALEPTERADRHEDRDTSS